ncbi:MAG TPA: PEGA domain-containing protein [Candidatus Saccharimonadales bacterium]|nr:PEGA domain-containing protein [Candidatus Saccharimonadales bacterium]
MLQIDFQSKRFKRAIRFFTYGIMTMATLGLTTLVIMLAMGYRFDRTQHGVIREGLLQLAAHPVDAHYKINGKTYKSLTPDKQTLPAGSYSIEMDQDGYRSWQKQIDIVAGHVHWINYPRLIPTNLETKVVKDYEAVSFARISPDKRWLLVNPGGQDKDKLELVDVKDPAKTQSTTLTIPDTELTQVNGQLGQLQFVEWSLDSKQFLIKHVNGNVTEYLHVDRSKPSEAINLSKKFDLTIDDAHFSGGNTNIIYARTKDVLRRFDIGANTVSGALMTGVEQFELFGDSTIIFHRLKATTDSSAAQQQEVGMRIKDKDTILQLVPAAEDITVNYSEFDGHNYYVIADRTKQTTTIYQDIDNAANRQHPFAQFSGIAPNVVKFNGDSRFLLLQQGTQLGIYDFYEQQKFGYTVNSLNDKFPVTWLDAFHIAGVIGDQLQVWDFDGTNQQALVRADPSLDPLLSEDSDTLYTIFKAPAGSSTTRPYSLTSTSLKVVKK